MRADIGGITVQPDCIYRMDLDIFLQPAVRTTIRISYTGGIMKKAIQKLREKMLKTGDIKDTIAYYKALKALTDK